MTISYSGSFFRLVLRWKGSLWKAVWRELLLFLFFYYCLSLMYRLLLTDKQRNTFEDMTLMFDSFTQRIPVSFLLGFFVTAVVRRWWEQFQLVAWPDDILSYINLIIPGTDSRAVTTRRTIARWLCLTAALSWRDISKSVRRRFPTMEHLINGNLMTRGELRVYDSITTDTIKWSLPMFWIRSVVDSEISQQRNNNITSTSSSDQSANQSINNQSINICSFDEDGCPILNDFTVPPASPASSSQYGPIRSPPPPPVMAMFHREMNKYRSCFRQLYCYDWVCIPLVYTQVAALATYGYFAICILGRQYLDPSKMRPGNTVDLYIPYFTILQFTFYVGWFKVGQYLMRPFEEDDDDIELNYLLDRHVQTAFSMVDEIQKMEIPPIEDPFSGISLSIPHTRMSIRRKEHPPKLLARVESKCKGDEEVVQSIDIKEPLKGTSRIRQF